MGGSNADYGQSNGQTADPMASMQMRQQPSAHQGQMFGKMDAWNVESSHPEQIAAGFNQGVQSGVGIGTGTGMNSNKEAKSKKGTKGSSGNQMVDEYGYPYSLDANGERIYDIGSVQIS